MFAFLETLAFISTIICFLLWHSLSEEQKHCTERGQTILNLEAKINELYSRIDDLYIQSKADLEYAIHSEIIHAQSHEKFLMYSADDLTKIILKHLWFFYPKIKYASDLSAYDFEKLIKISICADRNLLDADHGYWIGSYKKKFFRRTKTGKYVLWKGDLDGYFRITATGRYVLVTDEEMEKIKNMDYDFILDEIEKNPEERSLLW